MRLDLEAMSREYKDRGLTILRGFLPTEVASRWVADILHARDEGHGKMVVVEDERGEQASGIGGNLRYEVVGGHDCARLLPEVMAVYHCLPALLSVITEQDVVVSPYPRSAVVAKIYRAAGFGQGWHFDTNGISALLFLTDNSEGATMVNPLTGGHTESILPAAGSLIVMRGREVWHRAGYMTKETKVMLPLNFYVNGDTWRPGDIDDLIYGRAE